MVNALIDPPESGDSQINLVVYCFSKGVDW